MMSEITRTQALLCIERAADAIVDAMRLSGISEGTPEHRVLMEMYGDILTRATSDPFAPRAFTPKPNEPDYCAYCDCSRRSHGPALSCATAEARYKAAADEGKNDA